MKKFFGLIAALLVLGIAWHLFSGGSLSPRSIKKRIVQEAQDAVLSTVDPENVATLAMKTINLTQGEKGVELWRLKADWGNIRRKDNVMELEKPRFTYYMPPDNKAVTIVAEKGEIVQEEQLIRFIDSVVATYEGRTLQAPRLVYYGKKREMVCPQGGVVQGDGYEGSAENTIFWQIKDQRIDAVGNIHVLFENDLFTPRSEASPEPSSESKPSSEESRDTHAN